MVKGHACRNVTFPVMPSVPARMISPLIARYGGSVRAPLDVPRVGQQVFTMDEVFVGRVVQVVAAEFAVQDARTIWLPRDAVFTVSDQRVTLICAHSGLENYIVESR